MTSSAEHNTVKNGKKRDNFKFLWEIVFDNTFLGRFKSRYMYSLNLLQYKSRIVSVNPIIYVYAF